MPLPGGPSDKFGNLYELWWTVLQFLRMLHGKAESIRIEAPGVEKAEFVMISGGRKELHQAKRSNPDGKWSLAALASSNVQLLQAIYAELTGNDAGFVFVSGSDAPELKELAHRAQKSESLEEFETNFIHFEGQKKKFDILRKDWKNASAGAAYDVLRRVEVRTLDERSLEDLVEAKLCALFLADPNAVATELRSFVEDSIHKTISRDVLITHLAKRGFTLRRLAKLEAVPALINEVTEMYLAVARKKLIRKSLIPRAATQALLARVGEGSHGNESVLTGKAGAGKTGCVIEFAEALRARKVPVVVLAFRLDRIDPVSTTKALGQQIGLEESPALMLAAAAAGRDAVLIVDQLDAVSTVSGRSSDFLQAIEGLLAEARGLRDQVNLHVVVVCRAFDWENDHRLRQILAKEHAKVEVVEFSLDEIKTVIAAEGFNPNLFQQRQLELLRLAQNLSLFLEAGFDPQKAPQFNTAKELFDRYWDEKREAVSTRAAPQPDQWADVIQLLCDEMTRTQLLSVTREKLDRFAPEYLKQMASEGVLTSDGQRFGFGHESFFDYCFARGFVQKAQPLVEFLIGTEQHLFRRAQVRQVLAYLRDADRHRYCKELLALLTDERVRTHLKDLAVALAMNVPNPEDDEWAVFEHWLNSELDAFAIGKKNEDKFASLVWQHFFASQSWFYLADRRGLVTTWLDSSNERTINMAVQYLNFHQRHVGDRVAELLEPFVGKGGDWTLRLRHVMVWANHGNSRRFFEFFLRLIDDGTLDEARGPIASNSTFWSMMHGMSEARPEWIPEVLAHWLRRRFAVIHQTSKDAEPAWDDLFNHDEFGSTYFHTSAAKAPDAFVQHVLPVILEITDAAVFADVEPPRHGHVWLILFNTQYATADCACREALVAALETIAKSDPAKLGNVIAELRLRDTYIANYFLLSIYKAGVAKFADEAAILLCDQPWRLQCGFSDSNFWVAVQLIRAVTPLCSMETLAKLEMAILSFSPNYERSKDGHRLAGSACFTLLSAIPTEKRSLSAQTRYEQLQRKFGAPPPPPQDIRVYTVVSPIAKQAAEKMNDDQWLKAIAKYSSEERVHRWEHPEKGGAWELAGMLREFVRNEPERFARLCLNFPPGTNPAYIERTLDGLKGTSASTELKLEVCQKAFAESRQECGKAIGDLIGSIEDPLPNSAVEMLHWLATDHPDPEKELWSEEATGGRPYYGGDILTHGINTTRGRTAEAIRDLIQQDATYVTRFRPTLERLVNDQSISVRTCAASTVLAVARHDMPLALDLFDKLAASDDKLFATHYVDQFLFYGMGQHFDRLRPYVERMLKSKALKVAEGGARLASIAALSHKNAAVLVKQAMADGPSQRLGVAQVAAHNIGNMSCRTWCEEHLLLLFNDSDKDVLQEVASCFRYLEKQPLENYKNLITAFCDSAAYQQDSFSILHVLDDSVHRLPGMTCVVCEKFLLRFSDEAKDIRLGRAGDVMTVTKLIFRTYHQHQPESEWAPRCLDLIDRLCLEGVHEVRTELDQFER
jgi:hypothetical protein